VVVSSPADTSPGSAPRLTESARLALCRLPIEAGSSPHDAFRRIAEIAADTLAVDRVGVWLFTPDHQALRCATLFERPTREHSGGAVLRVADAPAYFRSVTERRVVAVTPADDPDLADLYFRPLGVACSLDAAVYLKGQPIGVACHEHTTARDWTAEDRDFAAAVADHVAISLLRSEVHDLETRRWQPVPPPDDPASAAVGHDFKNLLTVILGQAELLARKPSQTDDARHSLRQIADAAEAGAVLADELMGLGRPTRRAERVLRVGEAVEGMVPLLRTAAGDRVVEFTRSRGAGRVLIDPAQLERVLLNLVLNARDASQAGGVIRVTVGGEAVPDPDGTPRWFARVEVADAGAGMTAEVLARIFEPYFTTKGDGKGTGLGLAAVKRVVERAGGFVRVDSTPGAGTTFRVYLPRVGGSVALGG
jgi:K+-sensing histidine kinase KdpD